MSHFDHSTYASVFAPLLEQAPQNELGPGKPMTAMKKALSAITLEAAFAPHKIVDRDMAASCLSGLWLRYDFLDESHTISQSIETITGSFWHGIMHRREPDYSNAKYWFRRVGRHPIFPSLASAARELAVASKLDRQSAFLAEQTEWDAYRFVDLVAAVADGQSSTSDLCRQIQRVEWELLFDHCFREASASV